MGTSRRDFLVRSALGTAGILAACKAPAVLGTSVRTVIQTAAGVPRVDGAGVHLTRVIGQPSMAPLDPFILLDRFHSRNPADYVRGFPDHPHRGFETVTVMLEGAVKHHDSRGNQGTIVGGGAQWMTAGRGIVHSEMPQASADWMSGFQFWINLPAKEKMCPQEYQDLQPDRLTEAKLSSSGSKVRVIAGDANGVVGPVHHRVTQPLLLTLMLEDDRPFEVDLPAGHTAFAFVHEGEVQLGPESKPETVRAGTLAILGEGRRIRVRAPNQRSGLVLAAARPLREPIAQRGPFVMNTEAELNQAVEDYRNGVLDKA